MPRVGRGKALIVALIALLVGGISYALGVGSLLGQQAEASVLDASAFTFDPPAPLSLVSPATVAITIGVLAIVAWVVHGFGRALWLVIFSAGAIIVSQLLKSRLLDRPDFFEIDAPNTFPSGHMTVFAVIAGASVWAVPYLWRTLVGILAASLMGVVAWQLLEFGWHRPSDVLGALALGVLAFALAAALRLPRGARTVRLPGTVSSALNGILRIILVVAGVALTLGGLAMVLLATLQKSDALMLAAGEIALVGASALAARALITVSG